MILDTKGREFVVAFTRLNARVFFEDFDFHSWNYANKVLFFSNTTLIHYTNILNCVFILSPNFIFYICVNTANIDAAVL